MSLERFYLTEANEWTQKAEEHIRLADFCHEQAARLLGKITVEPEQRPELVLLEGGLE